MTNKPKLICSVCNEPIKPNWHGWAGGNNAQPYNDGRCCDRCDSEVVIPMRIVQIMQQRRKEERR